MSEHKVVFGDASQSAFAPAGRACEGELRASVSTLATNPLLEALLDATDVFVVVLNRERQILAGNSVLFEALGVEAPESVCGLRPGEALGCTSARKCPGGCGTAPECSTCGAVLAILECQRTGGVVEKDCLMTLCRGGEEHAQEFRVRASHLSVGSEDFTIVGIRDVSAEKRRDALERIFLHDLANTVSPLVNWAWVLAARAQGEAADLGIRIGILARRLQREIDDQRTLMQAERGTLATEQKAVEPLTVLESAVAILRDEWESRRRALEVVRREGLRPILTDESLLVRVLVNMLKNALEATPEHGVVKSWVEDTPGGCEFRVWNPGAIPHDIALQVFRRSFSTKAGSGRGLGTFSMKLLGERYLGGVVDFESKDGAGTTFFIRLPYRH